MNTGGFRPLDSEEDLAAGRLPKMTALVGVLSGTPEAARTMHAELYRLALESLTQFVQSVAVDPSAPMAGAAERAARFLGVIDGGSRMALRSPHAALEMKRDAFAEGLRQHRERADERWLYLDREGMPALYAQMMLAAPAEHVYPFPVPPLGLVPLRIPLAHVVFRTWGQSKPAHAHGHLIASYIDPATGNLYPPAYLAALVNFDPASLDERLTGYLNHCDPHINAHLAAMQDAYLTVASNPPT